MGDHQNKRDYRHLKPGVITYRHAMEWRNTLRGHTDYVDSLCLLGDGTTLVSGSNDRTMRFWKTMTGECVNTLRGHTRDVTSLCLLGDGALECSIQWRLSAQSNPERLPVQRVHHALTLLQRALLLWLSFASFVRALVPVLNHLRAHVPALNHATVCGTGCGIFDTSGTTVPKWASAQEPRTAGRREREERGGKLPAEERTGVGGG